MDKKFKFGDKVKVISRDNKLDPEIGTFGVVELNDDDGTVLVAFDGFHGFRWATSGDNNFWWMTEEELELVTTTPKFQLGDRVEYIKTDRYMSDPEIGAVGTVAKIDDDLEDEEAYLVAFDGFQGHCGSWANGESDLPKSNGWWVREDDIKLSTISTVSTGSPIENLSKTYLDLINKVFHDVRLTSTERCKQIDSLIAVYNQKLRELEANQRKFKVGDIIVGIPNNGYGVTTDRAVVQVTKLLDGGDMEVVVLEFNGNDDYEAGTFVGNKYDVEEDYFRKVVE